MRLLAFLLIWISLGVGAVTATTAYSWRIPDQGDESFQIGAEGETRYAVLAAPAGRDAQGDPIAEADTELKPEVVAALRDAEVERVRVKTFRIGRWTHLPYFAVACVGLLAGAILTRLSAARAARLADEVGEEADEMSPQAAVAELRRVVGELLEETRTATDDNAACVTVTHKLGDAIRDFVPAVTEQRERLVGRMGLGSYAALMDVFAAAERGMNRAWSAAADDCLDESIDALERAGERLAVAEDKLSGRTPSLLPLG